MESGAGPPWKFCSRGWENRRAGPLTRAGGSEPPVQGWSCPLSVLIQPSLFGLQQQSNFPECSGLLRILAPLSWLGGFCK